MQKTDLIKASEKPEHIRKHRGNAHVIGSKALKHVSEQNIHDILSRFEQAYALMIDERENPGRQEFCLKTSAPVGTDAVINAEDIIDGAAFEVVRDLGTPYAGKVKVALINVKDMPTTNLVHGIYGPYGNSGKAGIYTMTFGQPGTELPKELGSDEPEPAQTFNRECRKFWDGENGKAGHVLLATPDELASTIEQMKKHGLKTKIQELRLEAFYRGGEKSPLKANRHPAQKSEKAVDLGTFSLGGNGADNVREDK